MKQATSAMPGIASTSSHRELCTVLNIAPMTEARSKSTMTTSTWPQSRYLDNTKFDSPNQGEKQGRVKYDHQ